MAAAVVGLKIRLDPPSASQSDPVRSDPIREPNLIKLDFMCWIGLAI